MENLQTLLWKDHNCTQTALRYYVSCGIEFCTIYTNIIDEVVIFKIQLNTQITSFLIAIKHHNINIGSR